MASRVNNFVRRVYEAARRIGLREPQARLAASQAALETGYGKSVKGNNYFGIKAGSSWDGPVQNFRTWEVEGGKRKNITDKFRKYDSMEDSLSDWVKTMERRWPGAMSAETFDEAKEGLAYGRRGGYATDPKYGAKLATIERRIGDAFEPFDTGTADFVRQTEAGAGLGNIMAGQPGVPKGPGVLSMYQALNDMNVTAAPTPVAKRDNPANPQFADNAVGNLRDKDYGYPAARSISDLMTVLGGPQPQQAPQMMASASGQQLPNPTQQASASADLTGLFSAPQTDFSAVAPTDSISLALFNPMGPETTPEASYGPSQRLGPRAAPDLPELSYGPSQRLGPRGIGLPGTLPETPGVQFMDEVPQGMPAAPMQAPIQPPVAPPAPQLPPLAPPQFVAPRQVAQPQPPSLDLVPNAAPSVASTVAGHGLMGDAGPGYSYGYSPWGSGVARVHDSAPEQVKIAASGPGLFGAVKKDFGVDLTPGPGKMGAPLASAAALGLAALGAGPLAAIPIAANMMGGARFGVNRMDVVPQQSGGGLLGNLFGGLFGGGNRAQPQQQQSRGRNEVSFHGPIGRNVSERSGNLSEASRAEVERATRGLY